VIRVALAGCALASAACASVPVLTFESDDATANAIPSDGALLAEADAITDGPVDGPAQDAMGAVDAGCPDQVPFGATVCCGEVPCNGNCTVLECPLCDACAPAMWCCAHTNNVVCRTPGSSCP
jgi:hypothetical protein